jgi:outer membrane protein assembly factor BamB
MHAAASKGALAIALAALALLPGAARASTPAWTTYHHDAGRSGVDPDGTSPVTPALAWQSPDLGAPIWSQPLVLGGRAYVATAGDQVYALEASTGQIAWHASAGTPVPATALPCGDVEPTVGIVGTPVIDESAGVLFAVADTWSGSAAQHVLEGFRLSDGERVLATPVDPPGVNPKTILQRTALNLDGASVVFGFGGNDGDCSVYRGAVVSVPESGASPSYWQVPIAPDASGGGAVWATGGPAVGAGGEVFASTGNPNPSGGEVTEYDYSDSVVALSPGLGLTGWFEPPSWREDSNSDRDLGSAAPELLPGGLLFQAGKNGHGYLIDEAAMASGSAAVYEAQVCGGAGSFGGDSYYAGVIYIPCTSGVQALSYDATARTFTPLWKGPADAVGPPIVSSGLIWVVATGGGSGGGTKLYGLEPANGKPRYTEKLPSPVADHFASPSAAGGRLYVSTGSTVSAWQVAVLTPPEAGPAATAPVPGPMVPSQTASKPLLTLLGRHLHVRHGTVRVKLVCPASMLCRGSVAIRFLARHGHGRLARLNRIVLAHASFHAKRGRFTCVLHLGRRARWLVAHRRHGLRVTLVLTLAGYSTRKVDAVLSR